MRVLLTLLLLANLALLAWGVGALGPLGLGREPGREPQRLAAQFHPELLQVQPPASAAQR